MSQNRQFIKIFNYIFIFIALVWEPLQRGILHVDGHGRILMLLTISTFIFNIVNKSFRKIVISVPCLIWLLWIIYNIINWVIHGHSTEMIPYLGNYILLRLFLPYLVMCIVAYEYQGNDSSILKLILCALLSYVFIGTFILDVSTHEAIIDGANTLGNALPLNAIFVVLFSALLVAKGMLKQRYMYIFLVLILILIVVTATRKALAALMIIVVYNYISRRKLNLITLIKILVLALGLYIIYDFTIKDTIIGARFAEIIEDGDRFNDSGIKLLNIFGDRSIFYYTGFSIFLKHPLTGIGLLNYPSMGFSELRIHSEYVVQYAECGLIGFTLFVIFYMSIIRSLTSLQTAQLRKEKIILLGGILSILFISFTAWTYEFPQYFACIGTCIGFAKKNKR